MSLGHSPYLLKSCKITLTQVSPEVLSYVGRGHTKINLKSVIADLLDIHTDRVFSTGRNRFSQTHPNVSDTLKIQNDHLAYADNYDVMHYTNVNDTIRRLI